jgi:hypothetical protein
VLATSARGGTTSRLLSYMIWLVVNMGIIMDRWCSAGVDIMSYTLPMSDTCYALMWCMSWFVFRQTHTTPVCYIIWKMDIFDQFIVVYRFCERLKKNIMLFRQYSLTFQIMLLWYFRLCLLLCLMKMNSALWSVVRTNHMEWYLISTSCTSGLFY